MKSLLLDLPVETISNIFEMGSQDHAGHSPYGATISGICRYLRSIVLHLPKLWTNVSYTHRDHKEHEEFDGPGRSHAFAALLARSGNMPISIYLEILCPSTPSSDCTSYYIISILLTHLSHCHSLVARLSRSEDWFHFVRGQAPMLTNLTLYSPPGQDQDHRYTTFHWGHFAPGLKYLTVDGLWLAWKTIMYPSLIGLTVLNVTGRFNLVYTLIIAMNKAFRLKTLSLSFNELAGPFFDARGVVYLPKLVELSIFGENSDVGFILSTLMAPVLSHMRLRSVSLFQYRTRTFPSLTHLEAWDIRHTQELTHWMSLSQGMPSLAHIHANTPVQTLLQGSDIFLQFPYFYETPLPRFEGGL